MTVSKTQPQPRTLTSDQPAYPARRRPRFSLYRDIMIGLLLVATPFLLFPRGYGLFALIILPVIWGLRWALVGQIIPRTAVDWPILVTLVMVLVSTWTTFDIGFSIGKIASLLLGIVVFYAIIDLSRSRASLQTIIFLFILAGVGIAIVSLLGTQWTDKFPLLENLLSRVPQVLRGVQRAKEGFNPNQVGGVLIFFIPLQLMLLFYTFQQRLWGVFGTLFLVVSLLATGGLLLLAQSRGALGGVLIGLVAIAAIRTRWGKALAVVGVIAIGIIISNPALINDLLTSGLETEAAGTIRLDGRLEIWSRALMALADFPLGIGMNTFRRVLPILYTPFSIAPTHEVAHAHNHLLQAGLDLGLPGMIAYLALWLGAGFLLFQIISGTKSNFYRAIALGLMGGFIAHFIYGITDAVALGSKPGFVFWWALALIVATQQLPNEENVEE